MLKSIIGKFWSIIDSSLMQSQLLLLHWFLQQLRAWERKQSLFICNLLSSSKQNSLSYSTTQSWLCYTSFFSLLASATMCIWGSQFISTYVQQKWASSVAQGTVISAYDKDFLLSCENILTNQTFSKIDSTTCNCERDWSHYCPYVTYLATAQGWQWYICGHSLGLSPSNQVIVVINRIDRYASSALTQAPSLHVL